MIRVIFDRSAYHGDRFELLRSSLLSALVRAGKIQVHHTVTFLEETLRARESAAPWKDHLKFAIDLDDRFFFLDADEIWRQELVQGRGPLARYYFPESASRAHPRSRGWFRRRLLDMLDDAEADALWADTEGELADIKAKKRRYRALSVKIRADVVTKVRKAKGGRPGDKRRAFREFLRSDRRIATGRALMPMVSATRSEALTSMWALNPDRYPFFTGLVDSFMYMGFYAGVEHQRPLHENDQVDYQQLLFLHAADVFVSNDEGFPRDCFEMIWAPRGKRYMSCEEFCSIARRLA